MKGVVDKWIGGLMDEWFNGWDNPPAAESYFIIFQPRFFPLMNFLLLPHFGCL
jgi:hypothetical protein